MVPVIALLLAVAMFLLVPPSASPRLSSVLAPEGDLPAWTVGLRRRLRMPAARRRTREHDTRVVLAALTALSAELRAGLPPRIALVQASTTVWPTAVAAVRLDADIPHALRLDAADTPILRSLAACWEAGIASGGGLAEAVDRLAGASRDAEEVRGQLAVELAGPRATARVLVLLPLVGVALGVLLGADPLGFLFGSPVGWACAVGGVVLSCLGTWWTNGIASRVEALL